jgi:hypothetical protein
MRKSLLALSVVCALGLSPAHAAGVTQEQLRLLEARISKLEADQAALRKQAADATAAAKAAQAELAQARAASGTSGTAVVAVPATPPAQAATGAEFDALAATPSDTESATAGTDTAQVAAPAGASSAGSNANAFNPAISIILNGSYSHHSLDPTAYARAGFPIVGEGGPSANGFSLGESELSLASNIDDKFYGQLTLTAESEDGQDHIGVEEAFVDTTSLPDNFSVRVGRFYSNIGYLNSHHAHTDNFFDRPLAYQAFLGNQYGDDGVQVRWVAPTSMFLELGGEAFRGENFPSGGAQHGGIGTRTLFAHVGGDVGIENSWLAGVSVLKTQALDAEDGFSGDTTLYIADGTWKWAPNGNTKDGGVTLRGEYFLDDRDGAFADPADPSITTLWNGQRRGAYLEGIYRLNRTWDVGYRYDRLWSGANNPFVASTDGFDPYRHTAELTWRNSEFSLVRLQLSHDKPNASDSDNAVTLQYQTSLGAHGAHKF